MRFFVITVLLITSFTSCQMNELSDEDINSTEKDSVNSLYIYNLKNINSGFKSLEVNAGKIIFNDEFIEGNSFLEPDISDPDSRKMAYKNDKPIAINNCNDLMKYDIREIRYIASTDKDILRFRKRTCYLINTIKQESEKANYQIILKDKLMEGILSKNIVNKILVAIKEEPETLTCKKSTYGDLSEYCESEHNIIRIMPIVYSDKKTTYFVINQYAKMKDLYTIVIENGEISVVPQYS